MRNKKTVFFILLMAISVLLIGCALAVERVVVSDPPVEPFEFITFGHFDDIELDENNFPLGQRHIGTQQGEVRVDDQESRSGTHSLYIEGTGPKAQGNGFGVSTSLLRPFAAGETYTFSLWYRAPEILSTGQGTRIYARISTGSENIKWDQEWFEPLSTDAQHTIVYANHLIYIRVLESAEQDPDDPADWLPISVTFTSPPDIELNPVINIYNDSDKPLWIDDLSMQRL